MSRLPDVLWLNTSPSLQYFAQPLLCYLSNLVTIQEWKYCQSQDRVSSLDAAVGLLHDHLKSSNRPVHLIGHSTGGLLGLLYSRRYPEKVKSLTLLAVGVDAALDWQAHYYIHRQFLSRQKLLTDMVYNLFGYQDRWTLQSLTHLLEEDLDCSLSPHSLFERVSITANRVSVPLMVCGSLNDIVVQPDAVQGWRLYLKEGDRLWYCLEGWHFFHFFHYQLVAQQLLDFWKFIRMSDSLYSCLRL
ncbi:MAG: alpha/beta hydrolase [Nostoc sp.]